MIPLPTSRRSTTSTLNLFTPPSERELELYEVVEQVEKVARGFAKRRNEQRNLGFIDEAEAEARFIVTYMMWTEYDAICVKYPDKEERHKFFRMTVGFKLKEYFSHRQTSTVSYLKKKGIIVKREQVHDDMLVTYISPMDVAIVLEDVCGNMLEIRVVEFYSFGNSVETVAEKCGLTVKRTKRILNRIRRKLRFPLMD